LQASPRPLLDELRNLGNSRQRVIWVLAGGARMTITPWVHRYEMIPGVVRGSFQHENTLRTMMVLLGLTNSPGATATAAPMHEFFK
jgi:hypothetical protein